MTALYSTDWSNTLDLPTHLVVGLGQTGWSCVRYLSAQGHRAMVVDSRETPPYADKLQQQYPQVISRFGPFDPHLWSDPQFAAVHTALVSPGLDTRSAFFQVARERKVDICGDIEWYARHHRQPLVAITATNGKSTVTDWLGFILKALNVPVTVAGNIGLPVLDAVLQINQAQGQPLTDNPSTIMVLELSSYQLETCQSLKPNVATLLNLAPDHLDRYEHYADYQSSKRHIYHQARVAVLPADQTDCWPANFDVSTAIAFGSASSPPTLSLPTISPAESGPTKLLPSNQYWGLKTGQHLMLTKGGKAWRFAEELPLQGQHNILNAMAVLALLQGMQQQGLISSGPEAWWSVLVRYPGLPHRCQRVLRLAGAEWFDDSKATNVGAAVAAIQGLGQRLQGPLIVIMGGAGKQGADYSEVIAACERYASDVILMGQAAELINTEFSRLKPAYQQTHCHQVVDMSAATSLALRCLQLHYPQRAAPQPVAVLLSPACSSFDQYSNYVERGLHFQRCVQALAGMDEASVHV
jgi:UDP-N-acetylmuramoylalanine--D-glutamate ligase